MGSRFLNPKVLPSFQDGCQEESFSAAVLQIDVLSGHVRAGVSGKITVNGQPFKAADFQKRSCYVLQRDVVLATATVSSQSLPLHVLAKCMT